MRRLSSSYNTAKDCKPRGTNEDDRIATGPFNGKAMKATDEPGKPFQFFEAWGILSKLPKFQAEERKESGSVTTGNVNGEVKEEGVVKIDGVEEKATQEMPSGRNHAKMELKAEVKSEKKLCLAASSLKLYKEQVRKMANCSEIFMGVLIHSCV